MGTSPFWTSREIMDLRHLHEKGLRAPQMAEILGRSVNAVRGKCFGLNLPLQIGGNKDALGHGRDNRNAKAYAKLGAAINSLIARMDAETVARCLGSPRVIIPGTECVIRGQAAERRLAA